MSAIWLLNEADLHGLVDGHIEASRRADVLRRLADSPADRARIEAWQDQNDLIKSSFFGVEKEPIPVALRLVAPPSLHCVPAAEPALVAEPELQHVPLRQRVFSSLIGILLIAAGIGGGWMLIQPTDDRSQVIDVSVDQPGDDGVTGTIPATVIARPVAPLATSTIPNLSSMGFIFTSADTLPTDPSALVFHYQNAAAEKIEIRVTRTDEGNSEASPTWVRHALTWHAGQATFSISGSVRQERLRTIATRLRVSER